MSTSLRLARSATLAAGVISILADPAGAQHRAGRMGVAAPPPPESSVPRIPVSPPMSTTPFGVIDSRTPAGSRRLVDPRYRNNGMVNQRFQKRFRGTQVIYVPIGGYGYYDGYYGGQAYDANGVPLSASFGPGTEEPAPPSATYSGYNAPPSGGYTPDLTGSPYVVTDEGLMAVDFSSGERRAFPSCANQGDLRDPRGRPRTIFYHQTDYWMILRPGQRGRVQGNAPAANAKACYAIDSMGNVVLRQ